VKLDKFDRKLYPNAKSELRKKFQIDSNEFTFIVVGRLIASKGIDYLLEAVSVFDKVKYKLIIVGDGPLKEKLSNKAHELGLDTKTVFTGAISYSEVPKTMAGADVLILPSLDEGFPRVVLEAMALEIPVICSKVGGINDFCKDGENGYYFESRNSDSILSALNRAFTHGRLNKCAQEAYSLVMNKYDYNIAIKTYIKIFKNVLL
jgi:teichuronic acid biosynthesis glycosyltransferase TuaC